MKQSYTVGEFKARFPEALNAVREGHQITITYGRSRRAVAVLSPPQGSGRPRKLGRLSGKVKARIADSWKISDEEFLN